MLLLLCIMLDSDPDRRGRTSVCRRITPFLDQRQRIKAKFAKLMSASDSGSLRVYQLGENAVSHSVPVLGPGTALVNTDDS